MLSYNFNQKKETGVKEIVFGDRVLVEAVVLKNEMVSLQASFVVYG